MEITVKIIKERRTGTSKEGKAYDFETPFIVFPNGAKMEMPRLTNYNMEAHMFVRQALSGVTA